MKWIAPLLSLWMSLTLCSCVYEAPLAEKGTEALDPTLKGSWKKFIAVGDNEFESEETLSIVPFSTTEYAVITKSDGSDSMMCLPGTDYTVFRAYPVKLRDLSLIQIEWLGAHSQTLTRFHVCRYAISNDVLTVEMLNRDLIGPEITDTKDLRDAVLALREEPELFCKPVQYRRVEP